MKLNAADLRYITPDEFRVLSATEQGSRTHEVVPSPLIAQLAGLRGGGANKCMGSLARRNLIAKVQNMKYEGYRLTYGGLDYLALKTLSKRDSIYSVGQQVGVGKESDIHLVADEEGNRMILKMHRLGRISFRAIKSKRDYLGKRQSATWMHMSRLSAAKEYAFMTVLHEHGFPVPTPIDHSRHCIVMSLADADPMRNVHELADVGTLYSELMNLIVRLAGAGLIHGDYNEFNILINRSDSKPILIDFPQMVSTSHENAEMYFDRDVQCIRRFFKKRFRFESPLYPRFHDSIRADDDGSTEQDLDAKVKASGFSRKMQTELEMYMNTVDDGNMASEDKFEDSEDLDEDEHEDEHEDGNQNFEGEGNEEFTILGEKSDLKEKLEPIIADGSSKVIRPSPNDLAFKLSPAFETELVDALGNTITALDLNKINVARTSGLLDDSQTSDILNATKKDIDNMMPIPQKEDQTIVESAVVNCQDSSLPEEETEASQIAQALRSKVTEDLKKKQSRTERKHHTRKSVINMGRPSGSKKKQAVRISVESEW